MEEDAKNKTEDDIKEVKTEEKVEESNTRENKE